MSDVGSYLGRVLHHKRLSNSTGAIAGLAGGVSVMVGAVAAHYAPRGLARFKVALHLAHQPLIVKFAPLVAGIAVTLATAAGLVRFYSWCKEREDQSR